MDKQTTNILLDYATPKGIELIQLIESDTLKSPNLTGEWEKKRNKIQSGDYDPGVFISEIVSMVKEIISSLFPELEHQPVLSDLAFRSTGENGGTDFKEGSADKKTILLSIMKPYNKIAFQKKEIVLSIVKSNKHT